MRAITRDVRSVTATDGEGVAITAGGSTLSEAMTFDFSSNEDGSTFECNLDGGVFVACDNPQSYAGLTEDAHILEVRATDAFGNTDPSPASFDWTVLSPVGAIEQLKQNQSFGQVAQTGGVNFNRRSIETDKARSKICPGFGQSEQGRSGNASI